MLDGQKTPLANPLKTKANRSRIQSPSKLFSRHIQYDIIKEALLDSSNKRVTSKQRRLQRHSQHPDHKDFQHKEHKQAYYLSSPTSTRWGNNQLLL